MILSICIPIYQNDVTEFVQHVIRQCEQLNIDYEICLMDDASDEVFRKRNRSITHPAILYEELKQNVGRAKIRNLLAEFAQGEHLLFLDSDLGICSENFIGNYLKHLKESPQLINGGVKYRVAKTERKGAELRFKYGKFIEEISKDGEGRVTSPFVGCNFLISKKVFESLQFDEALVNYGYEDFLFAVHFEQRFGSFQLIDNPVVINKVDSNELYISKTMNAVENLAVLYHQGKIVPADNMRLLMVYEELKKKKLAASFYKISKNLLPLLLINLTSSNPSLKLFQLFKLIKFMENLFELES